MTTVVVMVVMVVVTVVVVVVMVVVMVEMVVASIDRRMHGGAACGRIGNLKECHSLFDGPRLWLCWQVVGEDGARGIEAAAKAAGLPVCHVIDAGRTQIAAGSLTVVGGCAAAALSLSLFLSRAPSLCLCVCVWVCVCVCVFYVYPTCSTYPMCVQVAVGPAPVALIDALCGHLKLM